ncbi:hypothetical protein [Polaribacter sp.]|uniref:hypothetical protein n=2 Tax=Flavobacteriaceae TaxID=49546 RepID=UPI004047FA6F
MNYSIYIIIGFIIVPIGLFFAYKKDYKQDKKEFKASIKTVGKGISKLIIFIVLIIALKTLSEYIIPINKNHGIEFNTERKKLGIPTIENNWKIDNHYSGQFETQWWKSKPRNGHFKKIIKYGIINAKSEIDYYQNQKIEGTYAWSIYDYNENNFEYYLEKPNDNIEYVNEKGKVKYGNRTIIEKINKSEFEKYIKE